MSTQPSIPPGQVNRLSACLAGVRRGAFTCVGWLSDPIWQATLCTSAMSYHEQLLRPITRMTLMLTLIHHAFMWTQWATFRRHPYLSRTAIYAVLCAGDPYAEHVQASEVVFLSLTYIASLAACHCVIVILLCYLKLVWQINSLSLSLSLYAAMLL